MRLELLSKGSNTIVSGRDKPEPATGKNPWRGKFDRRRRPRDEDGLVELSPQPSSKSSKS